MAGLRRTTGRPQPRTTPPSGALAELERCGFAADGVVTRAGIDYRQGLRDRLDDLCSRAWRHLGELAHLAFLDLVEPVDDAPCIDATAGPDWDARRPHHCA